MHAKGREESRDYKALEWCLTPLDSGRAKGELASVIATKNQTKSAARLRPPPVPRAPIESRRILRRRRLEQLAELPVVLWSPLGPHLGLLVRALVRIRRRAPTFEEESNRESQARESRERVGERGRAMPSDGDADPSV